MTPSSRPALPLAQFPGRRSIRTAIGVTEYIEVVGDLADIGWVDAAAPLRTRSQATLQVVAGLADSRCFSFRDASGRYLRHYAFRLRADADDGSTLYRQDSTFCPRTAPTAGAVIFQSYNYPDRYLRCRDNGELWIDPTEATQAYLASASFDVVTAWA